MQDLLGPRSEFLPCLLSQKNAEHLRRMLDRFKRKRASFDYTGL